MDIDLGYTNYHEIKSSCCHPRLTALRPSPQPTDFQRPHSAFQPPLGATRAASAAPLTHNQAQHASTSKFQCPAHPLSATQVASAAPLTKAHAHASTSKFQPLALPFSTTQVASSVHLTHTQAHAYTRNFRPPAPPTRRHLGCFSGPSLPCSGACFHQQITSPQTCHSQSQHDSRYQPNVNNIA